MKRIILLRHGEAEHPSDRGDHNRNLTSYGNEQVNNLTKALILDSWLPQAIISSDSQRTRQTLAITKKVFSHKIDYEKVSPKFYLAGYDQILEEIAEVPDHVDTVLLIGHNPGWSDVVGVLTSQYHNLGTGQAALMQTDIEKDWITSVTDMQTWQLVKVL